MYVCMYVCIYLFIYVIYVLILKIKRYKVFDTKLCWNSYYNVIFEFIYLRLSPYHLCSTS